MFRRFPRLISPRSVPWHENPFYGKCFASATIGILGTFYLSRQIIYGDAPDEDDDHDWPWSKSSKLPDVFYPTSYDNKLPHDPSSEATPYRTLSCTIDDNPGIARVDATCVPNFIPRWDAIGILSLNVTFARSFKTNWTLVGLFDGFGGPETKNFIASPLILRVVDALLGLVPKYETPTPEHTEVGMTPPRNMTLEPYPEAMDKAIRDVFLAMDDEIVHRVPESAMSSSSFVAGIQPLGVALSGASALLSFYDRESRMLKLALTGNSRAVLGRLTENKDGLPVYEVHVLTAEHTLENPAERARIDALYPDQNLFFNPQWQNARRVTRAFGLAMYKWSREVQERVYRDYLGDLPLQDIMMPPHITAEPDITTIDILPGDFLIMGSSGLWNCLTDEEAVGLVGLGLMRNMYALGHGQRPNPANHENFLERWELPVSTLGADNTAMYRLWRADKKFVCLDDNAAAHLARNALGGANSDLADVLLNMTPPRSWKFRDDINVAVIFFDR